MKIVSFEIAGRASFGVLQGDGIIDVGKLVRHPSLRAVLAAAALAEVRAAVQGRTADIKLSQVSLMTPVPDASKIVCVGVNYKGHILEMGRKLPEQPSVFLRLNSSLVAHDKPIVRPKNSTDFDYEGELAAIIGRGGRHISRDQALSHVAGYSCFNDGSVRDYQMKGSVTIGKNFTASGSFGPCMTTADEIPDPTALKLATRVNGEQVQFTGVDDLIFDIPAIISYVSAAMPLEPGDVIATGTPEGVGMAQKPPKWLKPNDTIEVEISGIGTLRNPVIDEPR
jgi:2-keto-4-pentenoate hydratase/2-oxohepta-3-ene-1,7-dioic acid hydratase in catechol pathway